jgi:hypothetical protein
MRAAVAFFCFYEQDFVLCGIEYFDDLRDRRSVNPILGVHEQPAACLDGSAGPVHLFHDVLVHQRFRHVLADGALVALAPEIAGERLFADDVLSCLHCLDDHRCVQHRRRTDIDNIDVRIGDKVAKASIRRCNLVLLGKIHNVIAPCGDGLDLGLDTVNAPVGVHMQMCDKPAPDQTDLHRRHCELPFDHQQFGSDSR